MPLNDDAPQFFAAGIQGIAPEGPNLVLSFATPIPSEDHTDRKYCTNVRIVMSADSVRQMVEFLSGAMSNPQAPHVHPMPEIKQ